MLSVDLRVRLGDVVEHQVLDLLLNVCGLVADRHLGQTREVDEGEVKHPGAVNLEIDGELGYALWSEPDVSVTSDGQTT